MTLSPLQLLPAQLSALLSGSLPRVRLLQHCESLNALDFGSKLVTQEAAQCLLLSLKTKIETALITRSVTVFIPLQ